MRVLGLVASPRKLGNSEIIVKEMLASLPEEIEKEMIRLTDLEVKPCSACYSCLPEGKSCMVNDDLTFLLERIRQADAVVIASACYFLGAHTSIKTIGDRLISVLAESGQFAGKKCVTATVYGIPGWEGYAREMVNNFARFLHLDVVGDMLVQAASPGEALTPEVLGTAKELAGRLFFVGTAKRKDRMLQKCAVCSNSLLQLASTGKVRCVMCGAVGELACRPDAVLVEFEAGHHRFSPEGMDEHARLLEGIKDSYVVNRTELFKRRKPYGDYDWWVSPERK